MLGIGLLLVTVPSAWASNRTILVFGDSLSASHGLRPEQGWVALLAKRLLKQGYRYRIVNASVSGETTTGGLERLPHELRACRPGIVILELGANDALRGLPLTLAARNLAAMVRLARAAGARVLLIGLLLPPNYGPRYTQQFAAMYPHLAREFRLPLVPFLLAHVALDSHLMQSDGLHPNARGEPLVLNNVWPYLQPLLGRVP